MELQENINKIKNLIYSELLIESDYKSCDRFSGSNKKMLLCRKISSLGPWLHKQDGLNLNLTIKNKLKDLSSSIPDNLIEKYSEGVDMLLSMGKINKRQRDNFINSLINKNKLVYVDGQWQEVNKLNTNYYDLAELLTDLIFMGGDNAKPIIDSIISNPKNGLLSIKEFLPRLIDKYYKDPSTLTDYTNNIKRTSKVGEEAERKVIDTLTEMGFDVLYYGGDGDMIDMTYGTDMIVDSPKHGKKTIQVKNNERSWFRENEYKYVDWVIIANPFTVYDNKTKEIIEIK